jgi:hypothetical protein
MMKLCESCLFYNWSNFESSVQKLNTKLSLHKINYRDAEFGSKIKYMFRYKCKLGVFSSVADPDV